MLPFLLLFVPSLAYLVALQGCCNGKKDRSCSEQRSTLSKKEPSKKPIAKPGVDAKTAKKPQGVGNQQQPQTKENKEGEEPGNAAVAEEGKSGKNLEANKSKGSKKGVSSKKGKDRQVEPTQEEEPQQSQQQQPDQKTERVEQPPVVAKEPNEFEKVAANEGTVVNPQKVKRMGNIDEIYEARKEEQNKELENLKSVVSSVKNSKDPAAGKKVSINDAKCVVFETADCPTLDDDENDNGEDPV